jgi:hypothetical protein
MSKKSQSAARHVPIAYGRAMRGSEARLHVVEAHASDNRLQAAVVAERPKDDGDPSADVPCTD